MVLFDSSPLRPNVAEFRDQLTIQLVKTPLDGYPSVNNIGSSTRHLFDKQDKLTAEDLEFMESKIAAYDAKLNATGQKVVTLQRELNNKLIRRQELSSDEKSGSPVKVQGGVDQN
jgi:hypothetical protein